ncbi:MAG: hypothetical protein OHK003_00890 [Anaerolineales bacterium]
MSAQSCQPAIRVADHKTENEGDDSRSRANAKASALTAIQPELNQLDLMPYIQEPANTVNKPEPSMIFEKAVFVIK